MVKRLVGTGVGLVIADLCSGGLLLFLIGLGAGVGDLFAVFGISRPVES